MRHVPQPDSRTCRVTDGLQRGVAVLVDVARDLVATHIHARAENYSFVIACLQGAAGENLEWIEKFAQQVLQPFARPDSC